MKIKLSKICSQAMIESDRVFYNRLSFLNLIIEVDVEKQNSRKITLNEKVSTRMS